ncbi:MAG: flagellin [bacterium]
MSIVVNNNIASLLAQRNLSQSTSSLTKSIERLSSGYKINKASDDAAGLSISENLRGQIRGNVQAMSNVQNGTNLLQVAESGLSTINDHIQRIRELCIQAANDTNATAEKAAILEEITQRTADISRIAKATRFNNIFLLDGSKSAPNSAVIQVGPNAETSTCTIDIGTVLTDSRATTIGVNIDIAASDWTGVKIRSFLGKIDASLKDISSKRSKIGALQNRLDAALDNLTVTNENMTASESRIRDVDVAKESANMTKYKILQQASASVLTQANQLPELALKLLG